ncbi:MAG: YdiU family protein [Marinobacterium sp.]|nr:YdiU family protein [Marinobacterium sp.]
MKTLDQLRLNTPFSRLHGALARSVSPQPLNNPHVVAFSASAAGLLDLDPCRITADALVNAFATDQLLAGSEPVATIYAGHQFGGYTPQLGDGRALLLGEYTNRLGDRWEIQLKGSGRTPYSRHGDGRAVLRSTIREYLASEAMAALNIPTTRALCLYGSDTQVVRDEIETGALLVRLSPSHIRFGHFEYFYYSRQRDVLPVLADFLIRRFYPQVAGDTDPYGALFEQIVLRTARLVAHWQVVGFAHGVLNTDNMSAVGVTLDYGPYGFLDRYHTGFVPNTSDSGGRYAFGAQPRIVLWNCVALAQTFTGLTRRERLEQALSRYEPEFQRHYALLMAERFGLPFSNGLDERESDELTALLIRELLALMEQYGADYNRTLRALVESAKAGRVDALQAELPGVDIEQWFSRYHDHQAADTVRLAQMERANPRVVLRNYLAQLSIEAAEQGDYGVLDQLMGVLRQPVAELPINLQHYEHCPPKWGCNLNLSCSS